MTDAGTIALLAGHQNMQRAGRGQGAPPLRMRFLLDNGLVSKLAHLLRGAGHGVVPSATRRHVQRD
jgi:hypothetical protein